jgi:hypothetical protein
MLVEPTHYKLTFQDGPLKDAHVTVASMTIRQTWAYNDKIDELAADREASYRFMVQTVTPLLVEWDLEKAPGEPWPLTLDGVMSLPDNYMPAVVAGWLKAINAVPDPTGTGAPGRDPIEDSLPMTPIDG